MIATGKGAVMKQIFDWLRERIEGLSNAEAEYYYASSNDVIEREDTLDLINEAEAKWEADCCEWKQYETKYGTRYQNCRATEAPVDTFGFKFFPYCGKRIKISEVE